MAMARKSIAILALSQPFQVWLILFKVKSNSAWAELGPAQPQLVSFLSYYMYHILFILHMKYSQHPKIFVFFVGFGKYEQCFDFLFDW